MIPEHDDPLNPEAFKAAATKVLALRRSAPEETLDIPDDRSNRAELLPPPPF